MQPNTPMLIAHRGGSLEVPENTMAAFRHAIDIGMQFVELDVQLTRDDQMVVMHDETVGRTTDGSGPIRGYTLEEIRRLDAGIKFSEEYRGEKVPTFREVMELCLEAGVGVVIEIKAPEINKGVEEKVAALVGEMWVRGAENLWVISFDHASIRKMRTLDPAMPLGYLYPPGTQHFSQADETVQAVCPYFGSTLQYPEEVANAHRQGKFVFVYTVDDPETMKRLAEVGVDGMVTDRPALLMGVSG